MRLDDVSFAVERQPFWLQLAAGLGAATVLFALGLGTLRFLGVA